MEGILLDEVRRGLVRQEATVDTLRTRAAGVFSAMALSSGLFSIRFNGGHRALVLTIAALFAVATGCLVAIAWPRTMAFVEDISTYVDWLQAPGDDPSNGVDLELRLASNLRDSWQENRDTINCLALWFRVLCVAFGLEVLGWLAATLWR
jgi:hypothetical protein